MGRVECIANSQKKIILFYGMTSLVLYLTLSRSLIQKLNRLQKRIHDQEEKEDKPADAVPVDNQNNNAVHKLETE